QLEFYHKGVGLDGGAGAGADTVWLKIDDGSGSGWVTHKPWSGDTVPTTYDLYNTDLSFYAMSATFKIRLEHEISSSNTETWRVDDFKVTGDIPTMNYFGLDDYWFVNSSNGDGNLSQRFHIAASMVNPPVADLRFAHSTNDTKFNETGNVVVFCTLLHPGGTTYVFKEKWDDTNNTEGPEYETIDVSSYLTSSIFAYNLTCGATFNSTITETLVAFDDMTLEASKGYDGWDSACGVFGGNGQCRDGADNTVYLNFDPNGNGDQSDNTVAANNYALVRIGDTGNNGTNDIIPDSGAIGLELKITPELYEIINSPKGQARLQFDWVLDSTSPDNGEQGWVKAKFGNYQNFDFLGSSLDEGADSTKEIFWCNGNSGETACPDLTTYHESIDVTNLIDRAGTYYLMIGAKATENSGDTNWNWDEQWSFQFDNIDIEVSNETNTYYLRKQFFLSNASFANRGVLNVLSDDRAKVYLNGELVDSDNTRHTGDYWNRRGVNIGGSNFVEGNNTIAVELENMADVAKFDLQLYGLDDPKPKFMLVMTDGQANVVCAAQGTGDAIADAIKAACDARENYGITVHAVGYSVSADGSTLQSIADCGGGIYKTSSNAEELSDFYSAVVFNVLNAVERSQALVVEEGTPFPRSVLYADSFISFNYTPIITEPGPKEILVTFETEQFENCTPEIDIYDGLRVVDAQIASFSGEHWTDLVAVDNVSVYNLSLYNTNYSTLGDPFIVDIPSSYLSSGVHNLNLSIGDAPNQDLNCSPNNTLIYSALINSSIARTDIVPYQAGCNWTIQFEDETFINVKMPTSGGHMNCNYTNESHALTENISNDAYNLAVYTMLNDLDFDDDGKVLLNLAEEDFQIAVTLATNLPYMNGPAMMEIRIWK
ncbi:MAG: hypothetical protein V1678_05525, partial [Candidatus Aenigmatarchaeota archaeon]